MMKNKLSDLNNILFAQLERLSDEDLSTEGLQKEIDRSKAITGLATQVIGNARLVFEAQKELGNTNSVPEVLGIENSQGKNS